MALGFSVLPRCAAVFNDNMVAQAVAAPLRKCEGEVGRGGEGMEVLEPKMLSRRGLLLGFF